MVRARGFALLLTVLPAPAQVVLNPPRDTSVISVDVELVNVLCTVRDSHGGYVKDLRKEDFEVREDGRPREISFFAREVDTPLTVALMLDVSGSVARILHIEKDAATRFFKEVLRPKDEALLVSFAQVIAIWQDLTSSVDDLVASLDRASPFPDMTAANAEFRPRGGTLLFDAVNLVAANKLRRQQGRKTMILISDGRDNGSIIDATAAAKAAQEADAVVYGIHYEDASRNFGSTPSGMGALRKLSEPSGGRTFQVAARLSLEDIFDVIREEMRSQYGIGFKPANPATDGSYRRLEVKTRRGLKVHARTGYYARRR